MKCPYCGYQHGWDGESLKDIEGSEDKFFELSNDIKMERSIGVGKGWRCRHETRIIMGCPKCSKLFMDPR
jgi:hypothetical protein